MPDEPVNCGGALQSSPCLQGERVSFTGTLASMTHAQAAALVAEHGGGAAEHVSRQTTLLVVGEEGWPLEDDGAPSVKLQQAQRFQNAGRAVRILSESDWLQLLGLSARRDDIRRLYTPAMLSTLLGVSVHLIRGWERLGLIRPVRRVFRLPYFDFQEVINARRLGELLAAGVSRREIEQSLRGLAAVMPGEQRPFEQLEILARNAHIVIRDAFGLKAPTTGQRLFDFDPGGMPAGAAADEPPPSIRLKPAKGPEPSLPEDWFSQGCRLYDDGRLKPAVEAFRLCLMAAPDDPEVHFHLAECLYRQGNSRGALERYYAAVEHDHEYLEAWTQIGCLHREAGDLENAVDAFDIALDLHPDYADAHFHKAETLCDLQRPQDAACHWQAYLRHDARGPWADLARQRLAESTEIPPTD